MDPYTHLVFIDLENFVFYGVSVANVWVSVFRGNIILVILEIFVAVYSFSGPKYVFFLFNAFAEAHQTFVIS